MDEADRDLARLRDEARTIAVAFRSAYSDDERNALIRRYEAAEETYWRHARDRLKGQRAH